MAKTAQNTPCDLKIVFRRVLDVQGGAGPSESSKSAKKFKIARYRAFKVARISVLHYKSGLAEAKKAKKKAKIIQKSPPE